MKIVEMTDRRLVIEYRPWVSAGALWVMGLAALYAGLTGRGTDGPGKRILVLAMGCGAVFAAWYWFAFLRITFDRDRGQVEHLSRRPFGSRWKYLDLVKGRRARIEAYWGVNARLTRLVLDTEDGLAQLEYGFDDADRTRLEAAVNAWLERAGKDDPTPRP